MRLIFLLLLTLASTSPSLGQVPMQQKLASYMQAQYALNRFDGVVLITRHDSVLLHQAYGLADLEWQVPHTLESKFAVASITKHITALAILQLVERKQLKLTDKLSSFFPTFPNGAAISLHHLLTHTAGLALDFEPLYLDYTNVSRDSALAVIQRLPRPSAPGTQVGYSNVGYFLLGQIIEKAASMSYGDYLQRNIFSVAGMTNTGLNSNTAPVPYLAHLYYRDGAGFAKNPYINWELNVGHDGLYTTAGDLAKLDRAMRGSALLSESTKTLMTTQHNQEISGMGLMGLMRSSGYGVFINPPYNHGHYLLTHNGGFFGATATYDRYPQDQVFVTVLSNNEAESNWIGYGLAGILFGKDVALPYVHRAVAVEAAVLPKYTGVYGQERIGLANGHLYLNDQATLLAPESGRKFFCVDHPDRTVEFLLTKKGAVYGLISSKGGVKETYLKSPPPR